MLFSFTIIILISSFFPFRSLYINSTDIVPAEGGVYIEACVGAPRYINPVLAPANDVDRDIASIVYSSLFKYDGSGNLIPDLVDTHSLSEDKKEYEIRLKKNIKWHDKKDLTADDVIFTMQLIQNPDFKSPLRNNFQGVEIEKIDDYAVKFKLVKNPYSPFLNNLTFGILPKHIWENITPASFPLTEINLKPIGSGPYKFKKIVKDAGGNVGSLEFESYSDYYFHQPYIDQVIFKFFKDEDTAISAFNNGDSDAINFVSANKANDIKSEHNLNKFILPRYFAVFFNQTESKAIADANVRRALTYATDKNDIINKAMGGQAIAINSPLPECILNENINKQNIVVSESIFDVEQAKSILETNGWTLPSSTSTSTPAEANVRQKNNSEKENQPVLFEITLSTVNWPELIETANILKTNWESIDAKVNLDINSVTDIQEKIRTRQYQALLFGQVLGINPDPFVFWHSSQKKDPGRNLALYDNKEADKLLEDARQEQNQEVRFQQYGQFVKLVNQDLPAIFLYTPIYHFPTSKKIQNISITRGDLPSVRFSQIEDWYIETRRGWK